MNLIVSQNVTTENKIQFFVSAATIKNVYIDTDIISL